MKKINILILLILFLITGCIKEDKITCTLGEEKFHLTFEEGRIIKYVDNNGNEQGKDVIDEMNSYIENIDSNRDAINKIKTVVSGYGGICK